METPEKNETTEITASLEKLQRSPVFDFLDNLSPIKPAKSAQFRESINPLSFAPFPSVFTSPHEKSLKELNFSQRHQVTDLLKPELSSDDKCGMFTPNNSEQDKENLDPMACGPSSCDISKILVSPENIDCDSNNPNPRKDLYRNEVNLEGGSSQTDENGWGNFISDETLVAFIESCEEHADPATTYYQNIKNAMKNMMRMSHGSAFSGERALKRIEYAENPNIAAAGSSVNNPIERIGYEQHSGLSQDLSRRSFIYPSSIHSDNINLSKQQEAVARNDSSHLILSGVGLQLSALSRNPNECTNESSTSFDKNSINTEKNRNFPREDRSQSYKDLRKQEVDTYNSRKKRRKSEAIGSCKRCNCKKSKCLKLYCECFAAGVYCVEPCACIDCFNKPIHAETVISTRKQIEARNPLAFAPKVIKGNHSSFQSEIGENSSSTPASARHKRGCNCKKSGCLKKYCECYQSGVGCSINCRCESCKNAFGRKDGVIVSTEVESDEEDQWQLRINRFPSSQHMTKSSRSFEDLDRDEMPEILQFRQSSTNKLVLSPNGKRVSPPQTRQHSKMLSPGLRSSRRLILTSIPSFPSLAAFNQ